MLRIFGGVFGVAVLGAVFAAKGGYTSPKAFADGFSPAIYIAAFISAVGALTGLGMPGRRVEPGSAARYGIVREGDGSVRGAGR